ncbi:MAG: CHASE domain-containing protein, partial [Chthoniobacteraceae bacterium]
MAWGTLRNAGGWTLVLLIAAGVVLSCLLYHFLRGREESELRSSFLRRADRQRMVLASRLQEHRDALLVLEGLFRFSSGVERHEFRGSAEQLLQRYPGVHAFQWAPLVHRGERAAVEARAREEGIEGFEIREHGPSGAIVRAAERPFYFPVYYTEPRLGNEVIFGYDLAVGTNRERLELARRTGQIVGSNPITLLQEKSGQLGWVLICPVYTPETDIHSAESRDAGLRGFLQCVFRLPTMFATAWEPLQDLGLETLVLDDTPGTPQRVIYSANGRKDSKNPPATEATMRAGEHAEHVIEIAGRRWILLTRSDPTWGHRQRTLYPELLCLGALIITTLLGAYIHLVRTRSQEIHDLVARRTAELAASRDSLELALQSETEARKRAETSEQTAEEAVMLLDTIFDTAPVGLAFLNSELRFARVNASFAAINGLPMEAYLGRTVRDMNPEVAAKVDPLHRAVMETGEPVVNLVLNVPRRTTDAVEPGTWMSSYYPIKKADGTVYGLGVVVVDVTDLRKAEEREHRLAAVVEQSDDIMLIVSPAGVAQYANGVFCRQTGIPADQVIGMSVEQLTQAFGVENRFPEVLERIAADGVFSDRLQADRGDGQQLAFDFTISPLRDQHSVVTHLVVVGRDVTRELVLEDRLRTSQKMEAVGLLAGGIAHDFNNLLQVIEGYTALCLDLPCTADELTQNLQQVREAASRAAQLTKQLLLFSRRQPLARTELDLQELTANILKMIRRLIGPQIEVVLENSAVHSAVQADRGQLEQVLLNLCVNARDAMPNGGQISIEVKDVEVDAAAAAREFPDLKPGRYVRLRVADTGNGMSTAMRERIFEPFFTTKPSGHGTGLGLSVVYGIVQQHEGAVSVESAEGRGTAFNVYLPALNKRAAAKVADPAPRFARGSETVLLVEDEEPVRQLTSIVLRQAGYEVIEASDGKEACDLFAERKDEIELVLMDVMMPRMGGLEAWRRIREMREVPILFCSGYTGAPGDLPAGAPLLPKPFT